MNYLIEVTVQDILAQARSARGSLPLLVNVYSHSAQTVFVNGLLSLLKTR